MPDQILGAIIFILGLFAGFIALLEPITGMLLLIVRYLRKLLQGPIKSSSQKS